jgi:hypothetical protein
MRFVFLALLATFAVPYAALANLADGALTGRVTIGDAPAGEAEVVVTSRATAQTRTAMTAKTGRYFIPALTPGTYDVSFSRAGATSFSRPVTIEASRVARADARLEPTVEEETVTSTAAPISVTDITSLTTHFAREEIERFPLQNDPVSAALFAPGATDRRIFHDGAPLAARPFFGYESVDQLTVVRGGAPPEFASAEAVVLRTPRGSDAFALIARDTWVRDRGHLLETASGGNIVPERLWFFASGWSGFADGFNVNLTAQLAAAHAITASYLDAADVSRPALHYTGLVTDRWTAEATVTDQNVALTRFTYVAGNHALAAGASDDGAFIRDRWSGSRTTVDAGLRFEDDQVLPRAGVSWDVRGNGRQALIATFADYAGGERVATAGIATAVGQTGTIRLDYLHKRERDEIHLDGRYSLFGRLFTGGSVTLAEHDDRAAAWIAAEFAVGEHLLGATVVERYVERSRERAWGTDLALRYTLPLAHTRGVTLGGDILNAFASSDADLRTWRLWARLRLR